MSKTIRLLLLLSLLLSGCRPLPSVPTLAAAELTPTALTSPLESKPKAILLTLKPCIVANGTVNAECGGLLVPEDRNSRDSRILHLAMVVVRARETNPEPDPLFYITGGPGGVATSPGIVSGVKNILWNVNARRDIIFLDQRGTNGRHRLTCDPIPGDVVNGDRQQMNDWMKKCLDGLDGDPRFYTTAAAMRDLDDARAALGYDKINLYGGSYGVIAEQVYIRMFPEHVRAAVMDHGTALDLPFRYVLPRASQSALDQVLTYCEQDEKCYAAYPEIRSDWKKVLDRLAKGSVVTSFTPPGADVPASITMEDFAGGIHQLMYKSGTYAVIPSIIHALATNEDWGLIVKSINEQYGDNMEDSRLLLMREVIYCFEPAWGTQPDQVEHFSPGSYYLDRQVQYLQLQQKVCSALPKPDASLIYGAGKPAPLSALMLNSIIDPQDPPSNMDLALKEFTKSRVIVEPTEGHETSGSPCRWRIITQYIRQGSADGLDISCMEKQKPMFIIKDWK